MKYLSNVDLNKNELQNARVQNLATAPSSPVVGQIYFNTTDHTGYIYDGTKWRDIAQIVDLSTKQDKLVSGQNIKTINGSSVLGSGNLTIDTGGTYTAGEGISITDDGVVSNTYGYVDDRVNVHAFLITTDMITNNALNNTFLSDLTASITDMLNNTLKEEHPYLLYRIGASNNLSEEQIMSDEIMENVGLYYLKFDAVINGAYQGQLIRLGDTYDNLTLGVDPTTSNQISIKNQGAKCFKFTGEFNSSLNQYTITNLTPSTTGADAQSYGFLPTNMQLADTYVPQYNSSPANKKYVDGKVQELGEYADTSFLNITQKGSANGVASLDGNGKVPSSQLPSYVDDVVEGYYYNGQFYTDSAHTQLITPETGKIYVDLNTNKTYRWGGTTYVEISQSTIHKYVETFKVFNETATITHDITHNLGSKDVIVNIYDADSGEMVIMDVTIVDSNTIRIQCNRSNNASVDNYKVVIIA